MVGQFVNDTLEKTRKGVVIIYLTVLSQCLPGGKEENHSPQ